MKDIFSENLKLFREQAGFSQETLAEKCNVSASCVSRWESGKWRPGKKNQDLLAEIFDVPIISFYLPQSELPPSLLIQQITEVSKGLSEERLEFLLDIARQLKRLP